MARVAGALLVESEASAGPEEPARAVTYPLRALGVGAAWAVGAIPAAAGLARCPVAVLTHHACPGCGLTRAVHLLAHGDLAGSLHMHALAIPQLASSALVMLATVWAAYRLGTPTDMLK